jgi:hypothetical protein
MGVVSLAAQLTREDFAAAIPKNLILPFKSWDSDFVYTSNS